MRPERTARLAATVQMEQQEHLQQHEQRLVAAVEPERIQGRNITAETVAALDQARAAQHWPLELEGQERLPVRAMRAIREPALHPERRTEGQAAAAADHLEAIHLPVALVGQVVYTVAVVVVVPVVFPVAMAVPVLMA